jgi:Endoribonuclease L-PSP
MGKYAIDRRKLNRSNARREDISCCCPPKRARCQPPKNLAIRPAAASPSAPPTSWDLIKSPMAVCRPAVRRAYAVERAAARRCWRVGVVAPSCQVFANIGRALAAAGARPQQVTKLTIFVANYRREHLAMIEEGRYALFGDHKPTDTLVGVAALSRPEYLLEVDAVAVIDNALNEPLAHSN